MLASLDRSLTKFMYFGISLGYSTLAAVTRVRLYMLNSNHSFKLSGAAVFHFIENCV